MGSSTTPKNSSPVSNAVSSNAVSPNNIGYVMGHSSNIESALPAAATTAGSHNQFHHGKSNLQQPVCRPKTKFVCTIGPSSASKDCLEALINEGMSIARLNMVHCSHEFVKNVIQTIRSIKSDRLVGILIDTNGPKIRTGKLKNGKSVYLEAGSRFTFVNDTSFIGDNSAVSSTYTRRVVQPGDKIYVDDGLLSFTVDGIDENLNQVHCTVDNSGFLGENKGINLPGYLPEDLPALRPKDMEDIKFAVAVGAEFITVSCIRTAEDVMEVRKLLGSSRIKLLSKIENKAGADNFESILKISDGIIIDRGYLGVEIDVQQVTLRQKGFIHMCNLVGKPVMVANHVLETLCDHPRPTRSEASDITSAIMDGVDALVLSAETASGKYPVESLKWLATISSQVEQNIDYHHFKMNILRYVEKPVGISESIASSVVKCAREVNAACIIVVTEAGGTARLVSKYRTSTPVIVATSDALTARQLTSSFGLIPYHHNDKKSSEKNDILQSAMKYAIDNGYGKLGEPVVVASGQVHGFLEGTTTVMQVVPLTLSS